MDSNHRRPLGREIYSLLPLPLGERTVEPSKEPTAKSTVKAHFNGFVAAESPRKMRLGAPHRNFPNY